MANISSRKLAVLLHADVVGSTALVQIDEEVAHGRMRGAFQRFSTCIAEYGGVTHEIRGDALIAEFPRVSDAVAAAKQFQNANTKFNQKLLDAIRPEFRVGIAMGEVVIADGTVTGEGIVLAQRLEQIAESGGVCIQGAAYETVPKRLGFSFNNLGDTLLKGFDDPVRVYALKYEPPDNVTDDAFPDKDATLIELPDEPSIAVLPFTNMSADPEQEFFSDGISEDIITALSKIRGIMVVARNSTFTYKGQAVDIKQVGKDQGVRYVLEGSVRKAVNRVRVTAQLIDATTGHHVWAEKYDRELDDIFAVQDELMREIVVALDVELREGEQVRVWASGTNNVEAWELVRLSTPIVLNRIVDDLNKAKGWIERALELDPNYATAWVMLGWFHQCYADVASGLNSPESKSEELGAMQKCAQNAIDVDPYCADAYSVMAMYHMELR
ncbi:MAG: adenylate/guanylate cyclase domain-containing protein, partial [Gammaproteobacteria bacterium]